MNVADRHLDNRIITVVDGCIGGGGSNEVKVFSISSLDNTAVTQEAETVGTVVMS
jgi:hypothetical protein